ncbi:MAG: cell division protein ZapA [Candidatus Ratteibacteria bacterium]|nr:cell division protein ZapA [Candidatus Ratteibacteria bacterium]
MEKLEIFGKKYQIQSGLSSEEIIRINKEIENRLKVLSMEYSTLDNIDILVLYVVELHEKIMELEKKVKKEFEKLESIKTKIFRIEENIREKVKKS